MSEALEPLLVRMCHNFKNFVLVKESFDDKTELWHTKNSFIVPVNYIEPILQYTKQNDLFQLTKRQKNRYDKKSLHMLNDIMDVLLPFKQSRMWKNWQSKQENFLRKQENDHNCI